jgi:hypothetical protein
MIYDFEEFLKRHLIAGGFSMSEAKQMLFARNLICVCIDDNQSADYQGQMWHQYSDDPVPFIGIYDFLIAADELFDSWDFPQRSLERREFGHDEAEDHRHKGFPKAPDTDELTIDKVSRQNGTRNIQGKRGKLGTFIIQVAYRQNATWQGHVVNVETNEKSAFVSAMELVRIIDRSLTK